MKFTIDPITTPIFTTSYQVRVDDINYGNHMGNERFLLMAQECRSEFFGTLGLTEKDLGDSTAIVLANALAIYKREVFYGDTLQVRLGVANIGRSTIDFVYEAFREDTLCAQVLTTVVCVDSLRRKPKSIPKNLLKHLS